ncbi:MAG TPA: hypothetical protein VI756_32265, partial [Blastocatellia bacterium]
DQAIREIESTSFDVRANLASGVGHFRQIILQEPAVKPLLGGIRDPKVRGLTADRINWLAATEIDPRYCHPRDASLAANAWPLSVAAVEKADGVGALGNAITNTWWARKMLAALDTDRPAAAINSMQQRLVVVSR